MNTPRIVTNLFWFVALAVSLIALGSFTLSFMALHELATGNGVPVSLGWVWPGIIDFSMVIYTAAILVAQLQHRGVKLPVSLTIFYSVITVTGNILHAPPTPLGWFVAALPPLSLILGTELLRTMAHHNIERQAIVTSLAELSAKVAEQQAQSIELDSAIASKLQKLTQLNADILQTKSAKSAILQASKQAKIDERRAVVLQLLQEGHEVKAIAEQLNKDVRTIRADIVALNGKAEGVAQ